MISITDSDNSTNNLNSINNLYSRIPKISLIYIPDFYDKTSRILRKCNILTWTKISNNLSKYVVRGKDKNKKLLENNVVYKITCNDCDSSYVGQTKNQLKERLGEHESNVNYAPKYHSVVSKHIKSHGHKMNWEGISILDRESDLNKRLVSESININLQNSPINLRKDTDKLHASYNTLFTKFRRNSIC